MANTRARNISTADLQYAEEVLEVYRLGDNALAALHTTVGISPSFRRLYEWAQNPKNFDKFIETMVPKATDILSKHRLPEEQGAVIIAEKKGVVELQEFLRQHLVTVKKDHSGEQSKSAHTWIDRTRPAVTHPSLRAGVSGEDQDSEQDSGGGDQCDNPDESRDGSIDGV